MSDYLGVVNEEARAERIASEPDYLLPINLPHAEWCVGFYRDSARSSMVFAVAFLAMAFATVPAIAGAAWGGSIVGVFALAMIAAFSVTQAVVSERNRKAAMRISALWAGRLATLRTRAR